MIKYLTVLIVLVALALQAQSYPNDPAANTVAAETVENENNDVAETATGDDDLSGSETFGFGYYPGFYGGYGYGGRRFGGYGYGHGYGYGGFGGGYGGYYRRPIYPVFG